MNNKSKVPLREEELTRQIPQIGGTKATDAPANIIQIHYLVTRNYRMGKELVGELCQSKADPHPNISRYKEVLLYLPLSGHILNAKLCPPPLPLNFTLRFWPYYYSVRRPASSITK